MIEHTIAEMIVALAAAYAGAGLIFAIAFLTRGITKIDPNAAGSGAGFRLLILPGTIALWPLLLERWTKGRPAPPERNAHRDRAGTGREV